jgi:hypothetical protein
MNTYTNSTHPKKKIYRTVGNGLFHNPPLMTIVLALVMFVAFAVYAANRATVVGQNDPAVPYSNALELQYARPWLDAQNKPVVAYGNALELQYARPWLDKAGRPAVVVGNAQEQIPLNCSSSIEMLYACKYGYAHP